MSPLDMLIFLFFILVTIKAVLISIDYWKDVDDELAEASRPQRRAVRTHASAARRPASVRVTPIKRVKPAAVSATASHVRPYHLKDKGAA